MHTNLGIMVTTAQNTTVIEIIQHEIHQNLDEGPSIKIHLLYTVQNALHTKNTCRERLIVAFSNDLLL